LEDGRPFVEIPKPALVAVDLMSFWQRIATDAKNAANDVYSHWIIGDDAGKSVLITMLYKPTSKDPLGLSFLEINRRAYVKSVAPGSVAAQAGILPQDAVQLVVPIRREWEVDAATEPQVDEEEEEDDHLGDEEKLLRRTDRVARSYGLKLEKKGARTSYNQLLRLLSGRVFHGNPKAINEHFLSPPIKQECNKKKSASLYKTLSCDTNNSAAWDDPPIPSKICAPIVNEPENKDNNNEYLQFDRKRSSSTEQSDYDDHTESETPSSILFVLRRTRQRHSSEASCFVPASFRLDDECDLACSLVRRLAPTADMEVPLPDTWEELVHDGTDWLLGQQSMLPPKNGTSVSSVKHDGHFAIPQSNAQEMADPSFSTTIPLDEFEQLRAKKLATLRSRITAETMLIDRTDDVEAATVRAMIQKAVGLAFVRASKVVLGVSLHGGSGIVISRLSDGTWSAPCAIGTWGLGLGLQFGLEVAEYIFILQTNEAMEHFKSGGSYTVGGNMGVAVGGLGREAYGAASVGGGCGTDTTAPLSTLPQDEEFNDENDDSRDGSGDNRFHGASKSFGIAPIVAYAKSQGLYVGVSLEGSRIFTRNDINCRAYKFSSGRNITANDILSGKVPTPPEAEELYAALHSVEFTHEMSRLPRPPEVLRKDSANAWAYDRSIVVQSNSREESSFPPRLRRPFSFFSDLSSREEEECTAFEAQFKNFLYGGVSVQRLIVDLEGSSDRTGKERRTLWLMLPEIGSLRLGFISKLSDGEGVVSNKSSTQRARRDDSSRHEVDIGTVGSEELTLDSTLQTKVGFCKCLYYRVYSF
jgi:lipid-binding SYLF domain-containing protein